MFGGDKLSTNPGKEFEHQFKTSAIEQGMYFYRIKDVNPMFLKANAKVSKNDFDSFMYKKPYLFALEFKSTGQKSISFSEKIIKKHQIEALKDASTYEGIIAGFIFNFRSADNYTCFVPIERFLDYKHVAENGIDDHTYQSKVNKGSIPIGICKEIGFEIVSVKKKKKYRYYIGNLLNELINYKDKHK